MKLFFCDTETSGLSSKAAVLQFAGIFHDTETKKEKEINLFIAPHEGAEISSKALSVNGLDPAKIQTFPAPAKQYAAMVNFFSGCVNRYDKADKMHFIAWNGLFDWQKLNEFFERNADPYLAAYFARPAIDLKQLINLDLIKSNARPGVGGVGYFNLEWVLEYYGLEKPEGDLHDAMVDIRATRLIWDLFFSPKKTEKKGAKKKCSSTQF